jgi:acyl transferase domain-containing protein
MMAVGLSEIDLNPYLEQAKANRGGELIIACFNSPKNHTVSGDDELIDALKELLDADGVFARKLNVKNAYHSSHMSEVADDYLRLMGDLSGGQYLDISHEITIFSTVSGRKVVKKKLDAQYWVDNMVSPVRFVSGLESLFSGGTGKQKSSFEPISLEEQVSVDHVLELGPHAALQSAIKDIVAQRSGSTVTYLPVLHRNDQDHTTLLKTIGVLKARGSAVDLLGVNSLSTSSPESAKLLVDLPPYSFNHSSKVITEGRLTKNYRFREHPRHDLFGARVTDWNAEAPRWRHFIRPDEIPWVKEHMVRLKLRFSWFV